VLFAGEDPPQAAPSASAAIVATIVSCLVPIRMDRLERMKGTGRG
jgi:xanthine dehydrogenase molybdopterin-binding subunit B